MRVCKLMLLLAWVGALGCSRGESGAEDRRKAAKPTEIVGIDPLGYQCDNLFTAADVAAVLGGEVTEVETAFEPAPGTARACSYLRVFGDKQEAWSFDMDCRDDAVVTAKRLFAQYEKTAGDAGVSGVEVGERGMDHHGQALLFIDGDTPCHVRVLGPDAAGRLSLARLIEEKLVPKTAPMRPRPAR